MTAQNANRSAVLVPLLAGMLGAGIALLIAPRSGRETRDRMMGSAQDFKQDAQDRLSAAKTEINTEIEHARELKHKLKEAMRTGNDKTDLSSQEMEQMPVRQKQSEVLTNLDHEV